MDGRGRIPGALLAMEPCIVEDQRSCAFLFGLKAGDLILQPFQHGPGRVVVHDDARMDVPDDDPFLFTEGGAFLAETAVRRDRRSE